MELKDVIAVALGTTGTALGIANYVRSVLDGKVRLRVVPRLTWKFQRGVLRTSSAENIGEHIKSYGVPVLAIEVLNLSKFSVTITEVGLCDRSLKRRRAALSNPILMHGEEWPKKLDSRQTVSAYFNKDVLFDYEFKRGTLAYARTACDVTKFGKSDALRAWSAKYKQIREELIRDGSSIS